jgi:hypothetical protein
MPLKATMRALESLKATMRALESLKVAFRGIRYLCGAYFPSSWSR